MVKEQLEQVELVELEEEALELVSGASYRVRGTEGGF